MIVSAQWMRKRTDSLCSPATWLTLEISLKSVLLLGCLNQTDVFCSSFYFGALFRVVCGRMIILKALVVSEMIKYVASNNFLSEM